MVHQKIYSHFGKDSPLKVKHNQTLIYGKKSDDNKLENEEEVAKFLKKSKNFNHIESI